ncbi:MAG: hypothetical protein PHP03_03650 [Candidatus Pacebacteria bacterium]|nr:hypothetical protein [Candidatus Paceibacterota bacterium]
MTALTQVREESPDTYPSYRVKNVMANSHTPQGARCEQKRSESKVSEGPNPNVDGPVQSQGQKDWNETAKSLQSARPYSKECAA